jgi:hypothetical protein
MAEFQGQVVKRPFAVGSKSKREAVFLETKGQRYLLRQKGGVPYHDPELEKLVGHKIKAEGEVDDYLLLVSSWKIIDG